MCNKLPYFSTIIRKNRPTDPIFVHVPGNSYILFLRQTARTALAVRAVCRITFVRPGLNFSGIFLHHLIAQGFMQFVLKFRAKKIEGDLGDRVS